MAGKTVTNLNISEQSGVERTYFATWSFSEDHVDSFSYEWQYYVNSNWFEGSSGSTAHNVRNCIYQAPENALKIRVRVKPISKTHKVTVKKKKVEKAYFTGGWSSYKTVEMPTASGTFPEDISAPTPDIRQYKLYVSVETYDTKTQAVHFEILKNNTSYKRTPNKDPIKVKNNKATYSIDVEAGGTYKVRCQGVNYVTVKSKKIVNYQNVVERVPIDDIDRYVKNPGHYATGYQEVTRKVPVYETTSTVSPITGNWSQWSQEVKTIPARINGTPRAVAKSPTSIELSWNKAMAADSYEIEYTTNRKYFDYNPDLVSGPVETEKTTILINVNDGAEYFFRVRGKNGQCTDDFKPEWSNIVSCKTGQKPNAPTTWSDQSSVSVGDNVVLYWTHNSADNSRERSAKIKLKVNGVSQPDITVNNALVDNPWAVDSGTYSYTLRTNTSTYEAGAEITWQVQTLGAIDEWSDLSVSRAINVYAPPYVRMSLGDENRWYWDTFNFFTDNKRTAQGDVIPLQDDILKSYPLYVVLEPGPSSQTPVSYYVSVTAQDSYTDTDDIGNRYTVSAGDEVFGQYFDVQENYLLVYIGPDNSNFENGHNYTVSVEVAMDSGLNASNEMDFEVRWEEDDFNLDIEDFFIDGDILSASFRPTCEDADGNPVDHVRLAVYRREFDGAFAEIASDIISIIQPIVTDPHPSLNYARYRVVAKSEDTGRIKFYDAPPQEIGETSIIMQWDEKWRPFVGEEELDDGDMAEDPWEGSFLKLPYNVDISESNDKDVAHVEYIGRRHPVSYYGTQVGQKGSWKAVIDKYDYETILALRRLSVYMGDVYVREPSGIGYWATVSVSMSREHLAVTMPITIEVTRVEGGM